MSRCSRFIPRATRGLVVMVVAATWASSAALATQPPDGRRYEMVSPPDKNGADVLLTTERTRVSTNGDAYGFAALAGFGSVNGVSVASDYISVRSRSAAPGDNGWATHGISPTQRAMSFGELLTGQEPLYTGPYSADLDTGVFSAVSPLTDAPSVAAVPNLYRRTDLLTPGKGTFDLVTACPLCDAAGTPLPPFTGDLFTWGIARPWFAASSTDLKHVLFESSDNLTTDAPAQSASCNRFSIPFFLACGMRLYDWDDGTLRLAGVLPDGRPADSSFAGQGAYNSYLTPGVISDGADGHRRIFFTQPTDATGATLSQVGTLGEQAGIFSSQSGNLFMRVDHATTEQLNVPETSGSSFAPASFLTASTDGTRSFFMTTEALTDDAPASGQKIYMYDATKPGSDPHNLTLVTADGEPADGPGDALGVIGTSDDGHYFYFAFSGELVRNGPPNGYWIYLWHDGQITRIASTGFGAQADELLATGLVWVNRPQQSRVTPDGRTLLFSSSATVGPTGYDHGTCRRSLSIFDTCRELYVYRADDDSVACVSCNPSGAPATGMATDYFGENMVGGTRGDPPNSRALSDDGTRVFFSTPEALVPEDTNRRIDAYEYDVVTRRVVLLSSGASTADSYVTNADPSGDNVFLVTRERLVGWDRDDSYDVYDARVGGGFPEPPVAAAPCAGADACRGLPPAPSGYSAPASSAFDGAGNLTSRPSRRCKRGRVLRRVHGKRRCVPRHTRRHRRTHRRTTGTHRRSS